jgi:ubiquinone/menaquinone biosynthesis C-methylase UbiE
MLSIHQANSERLADPGEQATLRAGLHGMWASVAPVWREHADFIDRRGEIVTKRLLELTDLREGERVLELACGPGGLGLAAARRVAPDGEVVLSDVAGDMTAVALARAQEHGVGNVTVRVLDLEAITEPDTAYDVVLCRDGLMFALDPAQAARELHRVLRPAGRYALAVWGPSERNPWLSIVLDALSQQLDHAVPPPGVPGPFALQDANKLASMLSGAGLEVSIEELPVPMEAASFEEWWQRTCALAGPVSKLVASLPPEVLEAVRDQARTATEPYVSASGLEFPGLQLLASGRPRP